MIIIEGMDNSGKTTFAESLSNGLHDRTGQKWVVRKSPGHRLGREELKRWALHQLATPTKGQLIVDRWPFISEIVYGPTVRGMNAIEEDPVLNALMNNWLQMSSLVIYCRPPTQYIVGTSKDEMDGVVQNSAVLLDNYDRLAVDLLTMQHIGEFKGVLMTYDWTSDNQEDVIDAIAAWTHYQLL